MNKHEAVARILAGGTANTRQIRERQYQMYQSDRKGTEGTRWDSREH